MRLGNLVGRATRESATVCGAAVQLPWVMIYCRAFINRHTILHHLKVAQQRSKPTSSRPMRWTTSPAAAFASSTPRSQPAPSLALPRPPSAAGTKATTLNERGVELSYSERCEKTVRDVRRECARSVYARRSSRALASGALYEQQTARIGARRIFSQDLLGWQPPAGKLVRAERSYWPC